MTRRTKPQRVRLSGRRLEFKDSGRFGLKVFSLVHKSSVVIAAIIVVLGLITIVTGWLMFWRKKIQRNKVLGPTADQRMSSRDNSKSAALLHW